MTRTEHLLTILAEECSEVAQRVSKALRFGIDEVQPGQELTNADRITYEMVDLVAVFDMLCEAGVLPFIHRPAFNENAGIAAKKAKVEKFLAFSAGRGLVDDEPDAPEVPHPEAGP